MLALTFCTYTPCDILRPLRLQSLLAEGGPRVTIADTKLGWGRGYYGQVPLFIISLSVFLIAFQNNSSVCVLEHYRACWKSLLIDLPGCRQSGWPRHHGRNIASSEPKRTCDWERIIESFVAGLCCIFRCFFSVLDCETYYCFWYMEVSHIFSGVIIGWARVEQGVAVIQSKRINVNV